MADDKERKPKSFFSWPQEQSVFADAILKLFPSHNSYVEPFIGGGSILLRKERAKREVISDLDSDLIRAYKVIQKLGPSGMKTLRAKNWIREEALYNRLKNSKPQGDLDFLYKFVFVNFGSWVSGDPSTAFRRSNEGKRITFVDNLEVLKERLRGVEIHCCDYKEALKKFATEKSFVYLDPPWPTKSNTWDKNLDHEELVAHVNAIKGSIMLTYGRFASEICRKVKGGELTRLRVKRPKINLNPNAKDPHIRATKMVYVVTRFNSYVKSVSEIEKRSETVEKILRVSLPGSLVSKSRAGKQAYLLSSQKMEGVAGIPMILANEKIKPDEPVQAWGVVELEEPEEFKTVDEVLKKIGDGLDEVTTREFIAKDPKPVYAYEVSAIDLYGKPRPISGTLVGRRFAVMKIGEDEFDVSSVFDLAKAAQNESDVSFVTSMTPEAVNEMPDKEIQSSAERLSQIWITLFEGAETYPGHDLKRLEVLKAALILVSIAAKRQVELTDSTIWSAAEEWIRTAEDEKKSSLIKDDLTPVYSDSGGEFPEVALAEVTEHMEPIILRDLVHVTGSLPNWGKTKTNLDFLIDGPVSPELRREIELRIGQTFPPDLSKRIRFNDDDLGGPFTSHFVGYRLALIPPTHEVTRIKDKEFEIIRMSAGDFRELWKAVDVYMRWPTPKNRPMRSVFNWHFIGRSMHTDYRIALDADKLIKWTVPNMKKDSIGSDVETIEQARKLVRGLSIERGNPVSKPFVLLNGKALLAEMKDDLIDRKWLDVEDRVFGPGEALEGYDRKSVMIAIDRPMTQWGIQRPYFHEYFLTKGKIFNGTVLVRMLVGRGGSEEETEAGRVTPKGKTFWRWYITENPLPYIVSRRAVKKGVMPPDGYSALPQDLMAVVPNHLKFWEANGAEAKKIRDELVKAKILTEQNVKVVNGKYVVIDTSKFYSISEPTQKATDKARFRLVWQYWKMKSETEETERTEPFRQIWHLFIRQSEKIFAWSFTQNDPTTGEAKSIAKFLKGSAADWDIEGEVKPGEGGSIICNKTTQTPSFAVLLDSGAAAVKEATPQRATIDFNGERLRGRHQFIPEEPGSKIWIASKVKSSDAPYEAEGALFELDQGIPMIVTCPSCNGREFERIIDREKTTAEIDAAICQGCFGTVATSRKTRYAFELKADGYSEEELAASGSVKATLYKKIPERDGVQIWDPGRRDPDLDRKQLRPLAIYQPMKPRKETNVFFSLVDLIQNWATGQTLKRGVAVEPKMSGLRLEIQKNEKGNVLIYLGDTKTDKSKVLPGLVKEIEKLPGSFSFDSELVDTENGIHAKDLIVRPRRALGKISGSDFPQDDKNIGVFMFRAVYLDKNMTDVSEDKQYETLRAYIEKHKPGQIAMMPRKIVHTEDELTKAVAWASKFPGSQGAVVKDLDATYSLGEFTSSWARLKTVRKIRAIVLDREEKAPATWIYECGIGPVDKDESDWKETKEFGGKKYICIGKTAATDINAKPGDVLEMHVFELLSKLNSPKTIHWSGLPMVQDKSKKAMMTAREVISISMPDEIEKSGGEFFLPIWKVNEEERFFWGVVLEPNDGVDGPLKPDTQNDIYSAAAIRKACFSWAESGMVAKVQHAIEAEGDWKWTPLLNEIAPVTFYVLPDGSMSAEPVEGAQPVQKDSWLVGGRADGDALWQSIKIGKTTGFSIGGQGLRTSET